MSIKTSFKSSPRSLIASAIVVLMFASSTVLGMPISIGPVTINKRKENPDESPEFIRCGDILLEQLKGINSISTIRYFTADNAPEIFVELEKSIKDGKCITMFHLTHHQVKPKREG